MKMHNYLLARVKDEDESTGIVRAMILVVIAGVILALVI